MNWFLLTKTGFELRYRRTLRTALRSFAGNLC